MLPVPLNETALPRNFTDLALTKKSAITDLKRKIGHEEYIEEFLSELEDPVDSLTTIDETFKRAMFANWIRNTSEFPRFKARYKGILEAESFSQQSSLLAEQAAVALTRSTLLEAQTNGAKNTTTSDSSIALTVNETLAGVLTEVSHNGSIIKILLPEALRNALFINWEEKPNVPSLLLPFALDMDISLKMTGANGKLLEIRPPPPPKSGKARGGFIYIPYGTCFDFMIQLILLYIGKPIVSRAFQANNKSPVSGYDDRKRMPNCLNKFI